MKTIEDTSVLLVVLFSLLFFSAPLFSSPVKSKNLVRKECIFIHMAHKAYVSKRSEGTYSVKLINVSTSVSFFMKHPNVTSGNVPIDKFLDLWEPDGKDGFKSAPVNASLNVIVGKNYFNFPLEIIYKSYDKVLKELTYIVRPLDGEPDNIPDTMDFEGVTFFINNINLCKKYTSVN